MNKKTKRTGVNLRKRLTAMVATAIMVVTLLPGAALAQGAEPPAVASVDAVAAKVAAYQIKGMRTEPPTYGLEWVVLGTSRGGYLPADLKEKYLTNLLADLKPVLDAGAGVLHKTKYTENARVVLALTSLGVDATRFGGYDLTAALGDFQGVVRQGINGPVFALIALDAGGYEMPKTLPGNTTNTPTTRQAYIDYILGKQLSDGGWNLSGSSLDVDVTAMALQALAPYSSNQSAVNAAVSKALTGLSDVQKTDTAGFGSSFGSAAEETLESDVQVIVALSALAIPITDSRFVKNGRNVYDSLSRYYINVEPGVTGGFKHVLTGQVNGMATEQAMYSLVALRRALTGEPGLYDMKSVALNPWPKDVDAAQKPAALSGALVSGLGDRIWTGKPQTPSLVVKLGGKTLSAGTDYTLAHTGNTAVGKATVTITGRENYSGTITKTFRILPKKTAAPRLTVGKKQIKVAWTKLSRAQCVAKYQIRYRLKSAKPWKVKSVTVKLTGSASAATIFKNLQKGKQYQFQIRGCKNIGKTPYYGAWSSIKTGGKVK